MNILLISFKYFIDVYMQRASNYSISYMGGILHCLNVETKLYQIIGAIL